MKFTGSITRRLTIEPQQQVSHTALIYFANIFLSRTRKNIPWLELCLFVCLSATGSTVTAQSPTRIAVLDFGSEPTGAKAGVKLSAIFGNDSAKEFTLIDSDLARAAARGIGFQGSTNLTVSEARDLGA